MPEAMSDRTRIHYDVDGAGYDVLVLPGLGASAADLRPLTSLLSRHARVTTVDNRGVGLSDKPKETYTVEQMAEDAVAVLDDAGLDRVDVVGYSMGGRVALQLALAHPGRVGRLVLLATGARTRSTLTRTVMFAVLPYLRMPARGSQPVHAFRRQRAASEGYDARHRLAEVHAPTLVLHGRGDRVAPPLLAEELVAGIPGARVEWYDGGHVGPVTRPAPIADAITAYLD